MNIYIPSNAKKIDLEDEEIMTILRLRRRPILNQVPVNVTVPTFSGTMEAGQTLTGTNGTWTNTPTSYTYQWYSNGVAIGGATSSTFVLTSTQDGTTITLGVVASNAAGASVEAVSLGTAMHEFQNSAGEQFFLVTGDSIAQGSNNSSGPGPTPTAGTVKQYRHDTDTIVDIGSADVYNVVSGGGTMMPQMGIDYNTESGKIPIFISCGSQGSNFENETGDSGNNWSSLGTLRASTEARVASALAIKGILKPKAICVILGINGARGTEPIATIEAAIDDFFLWLTTTYPGSSILVSQIGRHETQSHDDRIYSTRQRIVFNALNYTNVHMVFNMASWIMTSGYGADNLHPNQVGQNNMGSSFARWLRSDNSSFSKWGRSSVSALYDNPSSSRKTLLDTFMSSQVASGNYALLEHLTVHKTTTQNNIWVDFSFLGYLFNNTTVTFTANDSISSNGTNNHYAHTFVSSVNTARASQNDFINGIKCKVNNTAQGTLACLLGGSDGADVIGTLQNTTPAMTYRANDGTISTTTAILKFGDDKLYNLARNGGTKYFIEDSTTLASASVASSGTCSVLVTIGAFNNNGTIQNRLSGSYEYVFAAKYSTFDLAGFITAIETLLDNW